MYYGLREDRYGLCEREFEFMKGSDLRLCERVIGELPQPRSMSLVDLQCWVIKLLRLHPEIQDLQIKGFFSEGLPLEFRPEWFYKGDWETHHMHNDDSWASYVKKVKRRYGMSMFVLCVDCSEIKHYRSLVKAGYGVYAQVGKVADHECMPTEVLPGQKSLSSKFPAQYLSYRLKDEHNMSMTAEEIVPFIADRYGDKISLPEAWRIKMKALEILFGTFYDSYNSVPRLLKDIGYKNYGNYVNIKDTEVVGCKSFRVLDRIFWSPAPCVLAFTYCRPVLCIKGTSLCGKYQPLLLTALALDANDNLIPVAFAIIEGESKESWLWFLRNVKQSVVKERSGICIIHDYKRELLDAIEDLQNNPQEQEPHTWRDIQSRWCIEHLTENLSAHFGGKKSAVLFNKLCQQSQPSKFTDICKDLDDLTLRYTTENDSVASEEMEQESVEHDEAELESQSPSHQLDSADDEEEVNQGGDSKSKITRFTEWIRLKPLEKWSLLHDTDGARYGIMGINIADIYEGNHVLKGIKCLPLNAIVEVTHQRMAEYFKERSAAAKKAIGNPSMNFPECVQDAMNAKMQKAQIHSVTCMEIKENKYFPGEEVQKFKVQSNQKKVVVQLTSEYTRISRDHARELTKRAECSCNKPKLLHKPCSHVIAVCCQIGVTTADYMSPYYTLPYLDNTWSGNCDVPKFSPDYKIIMPFDKPTWIPDKKLECGLSVFRTSDRVQSVMDEEEQQSSST